MTADPSPGRLPFYDVPRNLSIPQSQSTLDPPPPEKPRSRLGTGSVTQQEQVRLHVVERAGVKRGWIS